MTRTLPTLVLALAFAAPAFAQQPNPALLRQPVLTDEGAAADQARLNVLHEATVGNLDASLSTATALDCIVNESARWLIAQQMSREDYERSLAALPDTMQSRVTVVEAVLIGGTCIEGMPEGPFIAVGRFETATQYAGATTTTHDRRRVSGTMASGRLHGELSSTARTEATSSQSGLLFSSITHTVLRFENGMPVGRAVGLSFASGNEGLQQISTSITRHDGFGTAATLVYMGDMLATEMTTVNGLTQGWLTSHPIEVVRGHRTELTRLCYRDGKVATDAACGGLANAPPGAVGIYARPRLRRGSDAALMRALTRHNETTPPGTSEAFDAAESLCEVSEDTLWAIAFGDFAERLRASGTVTRLDAKVLSGACGEGRMEGQFDMLILTDAGTRTVSRAQGELREGQRHGRWFSARTVYGEESETINYTVAEYAGHRLTSTRITLQEQHTFVERPTREPGIINVDLYTGDYRQEAYRTVNGIRDGTSTTYPPGRPAVVRCYQAGLLVGEGACRRR